MSVTSVRKFNDLPISIITNLHDLELDFDNVQIKKVNFEEYFKTLYRRKLAAYSLVQLYHS